MRQVHRDLGNIKGLSELGVNVPPTQRSYGNGAERPEQRRPAFMYERRHIKRLFTIYANREASNQAALQRGLAQPDLSHR